MKKLFLLTLISTVMQCAFAQTETLTNKTIVQLQKIGLSKDLIQMKIQTSACEFDLSTDGLISLKKAGVYDEVIAAMFAKGTDATPVQTLNKATASNLGSGLYWYDPQTKEYSELEPSVLTNAKTGGFGETVKRVMISGLINAKTRASLSGSQAALTINNKSPAFVFVFDTSVKSGLNNNNTFFGSVQSPNEFFLVKLAVVKNTREVVVGKSNNVSSDTGIDDALKVTFTAKKVQNGIYEVTPRSSLIPGEYCFMFAAASTSQGMTHKVYDFSIK